MLDLPPTRGARRRPARVLPAPMDLRLAPVALAAAMALAGLPVSAQPPATQLPVLRAGSTPINATVGPVAGTAAQPVLNITQTPSAGNRGVIEWSGFNIGSQATVNIAQPNAQSVLVNRVVSDGPRSASEIYGSLNANGRVFLINPAGVIFGPGAQVNVGSLVASSLDMDPASANGYQGFLDTGRVGLVSGGDASVQVMESAKIQAGPGGSVVLVASQGVTQHGAIEAAQGRVDLAVAPKAEVLSLGTSGYVELVVPPSASAGAQARIDVDGRIDVGSATGNGGSVRLDAGDQGSVVLGSRASVGADSTATGGRGGDISVQGRRIALEATEPGSLTLSADGNAGGGRITVGGSTTRDLRIAEGAVLSADATVSGDGGHIDALATYRIADLSGTPVAREDYGVAEVYGTLRVRGGLQGGNGGHVETSGTALNTTLFLPDSGATLRAHVDALARSGSGTNGTWLIDPFNVTISNTAQVAALKDQNTTPGTTLYTPTGTGANLLASDVSAALATANVDISTGTANTGNEAGSITVLPGVAITGSSTAGGTTTLTLRAHDTVTLGAGSSVSATAGRLNVILNGDLDNDGIGRVVLDNATITSRGGSITLTGGAGALNNTTDHGVDLLNSTLDARSAVNGPGAISVTGTATEDARGVSVVGSSLLGDNIKIIGNTDRGTGVYFSGSTIGTTSGQVEISGVASRRNGGFGTVIGVEAQSLTVDLGTGNLSIAGRGDDGGFGSSGGGASTGLQYSTLRITTAPNAAGRIVLAGEAAGTNATASRGITFLDAESGGLTITGAGASTAIPTLHNIEIGAVTSAGLALDLGTGSGIDVATSGAVNFRPLGVSAAGQVVEAPDTPITVGLPNIDGTPEGFIVDTAWLRGANQGAFNAAKGFVIGSSQHNADIVLSDGALNANAHGAISLTLQNEGPGVPDVFVGSNTGGVGISAVGDPAGRGNILIGGNNTVRDLFLFAGNSVTQSGPINVQRYLLLRAGGSVDLSNKQNTIGTLAFDSIGGSLAVGTVVGAQGDLTVDSFANQEPITYDAVNHDYPVFQFTAGSFNRGGTSVVLDVGGQATINRSIDMLGSAATVDIASPTQVTLGNGVQFTTATAPLAADASVRVWAPVIDGSTGARNLYGCVFGDTGTCSVSGIAIPASGRMDLYPTQPTANVSASQASDGTILLAATGLIHGDTVADSLSGRPDPIAGSTPGSVDFTRGTLASPNGYIVNFVGGSGVRTRSSGLDSETVRSSFLTQFRSEVYGRNLSMPYICTAASVIRENLARETTADPLAAEWGKVRGQPNLSGCLEVVDGGQCAAF